MRRIALPLALAAGLAAADVPVVASAIDLATGVVTHRGQSKASDDLVLGLLAQQGSALLRDAFRWEAVQRADGSFAFPPAYDAFVDGAVARGVAPLLIFAYGHSRWCPGYPVSDAEIDAFGAYAEAVVRRYRGKVRLYEVWNEWGGMPKPRPGADEGREDQYVRLLARVVPRLKAVDPAARFIAGWRDDAWLDRAIAAGLATVIDGYSSHPYVQGEPGARRLPEAVVDKVRSAHARLVAARGSDLPIYVTEIGWPSHGKGGGVSDQEQADFAARVMLGLSTLPAVKGVWWYDQQEDGWDVDEPEHHFGLVRPDGTPKPGFFAAADAMRLIRTAAGAPVRVATDDPDLWILRFPAADGGCALALWSARVDQDEYSITLRSAVVPVGVETTLAGHPAVRLPWGARDWVDDQERAGEPDRFQCTVARTPLLLAGLPGDVAVAAVRRRTSTAGLRAAQQKRPPLVFGRIARLAEDADEAAWAGLWAACGQWTGVRLATPRPPAAEFAARCAVARQGDRLVVRAEVEDSRHVQAQGPEELWKSDSIQFALRARPRGLLEITAALTAEGTRVCGPDGKPLAGVTGQAVRSGTVTSYRVSLPAALVEAGDEVAAPMAFSLLVNQDQGQGRLGWLRWADGIGGRKDPDAFGWLVPVAARP